MDLEADAGVTVTCTGDMRCPGTNGSSTYTAANPCTFERKLCISCKEKGNGSIIISVQANGLPNHCFFSTVNTAEADNQ